MAADDRDAFGVNGADIADRAVWDEGLQRADPTSTETSNDHYGSRLCENIAKSARILTSE